jgi:uncharacterized membrane protein YkvA (DUF1232 family)
MFRLTQNLVSPLLRLVKLLAIMWFDVRVPRIARLLLVFAALYWICPFDLKPDFLPGGYTDDLWIVPIGIVLAAKLIPLAVFCDARKACAQAVCGIMCLSLTIMPSEHSADQVKIPLAAIINLSEEEKVRDSQNAHITMGKCTSAASKPAAVCPGVGQTGAVALACLTVLYRESGQHRKSCRPLQRMRMMGKVRTNSFLLVRGGHNQLYGIDGDAQPAAAILLKANLPRIKFCRLRGQAVFLSRNQSAQNMRCSSHKDRSLVERAAC